MIEIFDDISERAKDWARFTFDMALRQPDLPSAIKVLNDYTNACLDEREQEFVEFYFKLKLENLLNGNNNNQW